MSATLIPDYISVSEPAVLSFSCHTQARKPASKPVLRDPEQELRAVQEHVLQLRKQYELAPRNSGSTKPTNQYGYPRPSSQQSPPASATGKHYFVDETQWDAILDHGRFDDIVCGSGPCALAYIDKALELDPKRKILVLERGGFWLPTHFQACVQLSS
ncbi:hypothetical protein HD554DRAFT_2173033 [Boletus coccyginus]|nr:hypothetical protein HD554DRAFT_2173033 [Boletus coccyginus]